MVLPWLVKSIFDQQYLREEEKWRAQLQEYYRRRMQLVLSAEGFINMILVPYDPIRKWVDQPSPEVGQ